MLFRILHAIVPCCFCMSLDNSLSPVFWILLYAVKQLFEWGYAGWVNSTATLISHPSGWWTTWEGAEIVLILAIRPRNATKNRHLEAAGRIVGLFYNYVYAKNQCSGAFIVLFMLLLLHVTLENRPSTCIGCPTPECTESGSALLHGNSQYIWNAFVSKLVSSF